MRKNVFTPLHPESPALRRGVTGFTLLEIIVAAIIIAVLMWGLTNLFISGRRHIMHARLRMAGGELGKYFLEPLQREVREDQWQANSNCLTGNGAGTCPHTTGCDLCTWRDPSRIVYTPNYQITPLLVDAQNPLGRLRKVRLRLSWTEHDIATSP